MPASVSTEDIIAELQRQQEPPTKLGMATDFANAWAKKGANVALSPYHAIQALMQHGYNPGTQDEEGARNATSAALNFGVLGAVAPKPANSLGMFGGVRSKTANLDELELAKKLEKEGAPTEELISQTGWGRGKDDKWRYELPGSASSKIEYPPGIMNYNKPTNLPDIWHYPELYEAYPELKDVAIKGGASPGGGAYHKSISKYDPSAINVNPTDFIQTTHIDSIPHQNLHNKRLLGHEGQHALQDIEGFNPGFNRGILEQSPQLQEKYKDDIMKATIDHLQALKKGQELGKLIPNLDFERLARQMAMQDVAKDIYKRNAGEVEAMNAMNRIDWSDYRKLANPWNLTERIPRSHQTLDNIDDIIKAMRESNKNFRKVPD